MGAKGSHTVLVVDDDPQVREIYGEFLAESYAVRTVDSGEAALEVMDDSIDVVLLDRRMVGLSGDDVLARLTQNGYDQPVALVTAIEPDFDILELGFDDYVVKPVGGEQLHELVETLLLRREYDSVMREYFSLVSKVTAIQRKKPPSALKDHDAYTRSVERLEQLESEAQHALESAIEDGKFDELLHALDPGEPRRDFGLGPGPAATMGD